MLKMEAITLYYLVHIKYFMNKQFETKFTQLLHMYLNQSMLTV
jgi:hypothetical protein